MHRNKLKSILPALVAFANGKTIQFRSEKREWTDLLDDEIAIDPGYDFRIKPDSKYRPFSSQKECLGEMMKHQPVGYIQGDGCVLYVLMVDDDFIYHLSNGAKQKEVVFTPFMEAMEQMKFLDGTPFGIEDS